MQCSTVQCRAVQGKVQCNVVQYSVFQCSAVKCSVVLKSMWELSLREIKRDAYLTLFSCSLHDSLLNSSFAYESVHGDLFRLTESVSPVHGLLVDGWVPI